MSVDRLVAAAAVFVLLTVSALAITTVGSAPESPEQGRLPAPVTTSSEADFAEIVAAEPPTAPLSEEEEALTEMVLSAVAQTTVPEETTTTSSLVTTVATAHATQPKPTSPPAPPATSPPTTAAGGFHSGAESEFAGLINSRRAANGLGSLSGSGSLDSHARAWAQHMAEEGSISHSNLGSLLPPWGSVGENVAVGGSVSTIFNALVSSGSHDANMLGDFTHVGVGVWQDGDGVLWTVHVFAR